MGPHIERLSQPRAVAGTIQLTAGTIASVTIASSSTACGGHLVTKDERYLKSWEQLAD